LIAFSAARQNRVAVPRLKGKWQLSVATATSIIAAAPVLLASGMSPAVFSLSPERCDPGAKEKKKTQKSFLRSEAEDSAVTAEPNDIQLRIVSRTKSLAQICYQKPIFFF